MKKIFTILLLTILILSPNKVDASQKLAPKVYQDDYYCYDKDLKEMILVNNNLEPDENTERDYLLKNRKKLNKYDKMYLDFLNAKALNYRYYTIKLLIQYVAKLDKMMEKVPANNRELEKQRSFYLHHLRIQLNDAAKCPPIG